MNLEQYPEIQKWITQVKESSRSPYMSAMRAYVEFTNLNPKQLIDEAEKDRKKPRRLQGKPEMRIMQFHEWLLNEYEIKPRGKGERKKTGRRGASKTMAAMYVTAIRSFYKRNGFPIAIKTPKAAPKKENKKLYLSAKEVKLLVNHAPTLRDRAIILFMFQGGFDVSTICSLNYGDVKRGLENDEVPLLIEVVRQKDEVEYFTFVGYDAVEALKAYLNDRITKGEKLRLDSPLFAKEGAKKKRVERIKPNLIQNMLRETALKAGLVSQEELEKSDLNPCRPHALRSAFSTVLRLNGFDPLLVEFMLGHRIPYNGAYLIPPPEKVRKMYAEVEPQLSVSSRIDAKIGEEVVKLKETIELLSKENKVIRQENEKLRKRIGTIEKRMEEVVKMYNEMAKNPVMFEVLRQGLNDVLKTFADKLGVEFKEIDFRIDERICNI